MADTSLIIGNGNWAVKEDSLLGYNIIQGKYVPIEMNVSRQTTATRVNNAGLIELVPRNLLTYSQQIDNTDWTKFGTPTITTNIAVAPDGTTTADGIKADDAASFKYISQTKIVAANSTVTSSVFVKKETSETNFGGFILIFTNPTTKIFRLSVDAVLGIVQPTLGNSLTATTKVEDYGAYWRISCTATDNDSNTNVLIGYYATLSTNGTNTVQAVGSVRTVWGFQLEVAATATNYFPTTDRFDIPRVDYSTGTASLLVEPARTNSILQSSNLLTFSTTTAGVIRTSGQISPGVTNNAFKIIAGAENNKFAIYSSDVVTIIGNTYSVSIFLKSAEYSKAAFRDGYTGKYVSFNLNLKTQLDTNGPTVKLEDYANGYVRVIITYVSTSILNNNYFFILNDSYTTGTPDTYTFTGNGTSGLFMWSPQHELGSYATSYIPTTTIPLTRNADVISKTGISSLINSQAGTMFIEASALANNTTARFIELNDGTTSALTNNVYFRYEPTSNIIAYTVFAAGIMQCNIQYSLPLTQIANNKMAFVWALNRFEIWVNKYKVAEDTSGVTPANLTLSKIIFSDRSGANNFEGNLKTLQLYTTALSPEQLETLTTL